LDQVGLFSSYESEEFRNFTYLANELRSMYEFCHTLDASYLPAKSAALTAPAVRIFKKFEESFNDLKVCRSPLHKIYLPNNC
jgi:protein disulfide-isomerase A1